MENDVNHDIRVILIINEGYDSFECWSFEKGVHIRTDGKWEQQLKKNSISKETLVTKPVKFMLKAC